MVSVLGTDNICDMSRIYNDSFKYVLPEKTLASFLSGEAFDNKKAYSEEELNRLKKDINTIFQNILATDPLKNSKEGPEIVVTAGAPGAGKTVAMRQRWEKAASDGIRYAYVCPDDVCLKGMGLTYQEEISGGKGTKEEWQAAYNRWRPGSNAAAHFILAELIRKKYDIYFGTTSSGAATPTFLKFLKDQGYKITVMHMTMSDQKRWESVLERDGTFVQTTEEDVVQKGELFPQRIEDSFLKHADKIEFYYREGVKEDATLAARWIRNSSPSPVGKLKIVDPLAYGKIKEIHDAAVVRLDKLPLLWASTVEAKSEIDP
jgi:hypothetical protein